MTFILGCGLLLIPCPALYQLNKNRNLQTYNCSDARNFTYSGKSKGANRAIALANLSLTNLPVGKPKIWNTTTNHYSMSTNVYNHTNNTTSDILVVKLHYPGLSTWLPYSFNSREDTVNWFAELTNYINFQCVVDVPNNQSAEIWGFTQPALPNLHIYYASCAAGVVMFCISAFICCMNNIRIRRAQYDYVHLN